MTGTEPTDRRCPEDRTILAPQSIHGIAIDFCPSCQGVWLEGGQLGQIEKGIRAASREKMEELKVEISEKKKEIDRQDSEAFWDFLSTMVEEAIPGLFL